jgi:oxalate decarboxylase
MRDIDRRFLLSGIASGVGGLVAVKAFAAEADGHAAGYDAARSTDFMPLIPRRSGDPMLFTAALDKAALKATSGGWAREVTTRQIPLATGIAGAHLFLNPGGAREMHWHNSAEWAYVLEGTCQVTVVDPEGQAEVANYGPGDIWYFPTGHAHAIQTIGSNPCHAILTFNDGLYSEHGTFGLSDWLSRYDATTLSQSFGIPPAVFAAMPRGETYIMQGPVIPEDSDAARLTKVLGKTESHRHGLSSSQPWFSGSGGTIHLAPSKEFPLSTDMTGIVTRLRPQAMHVLHWHPNANEWQYVAKGRVRITLFAPDKRMAVAELSAGECAYIPANCGHSVQNIGDTACELVGTLDSGAYQEGSVSAWLAQAPPHLLANNLGVPEASLAKFNGERIVIAPSG